MIFKQYQQILDGMKTQTRRLVKANELASGSRPSRWIHAVWIDIKGVHDRRHEQHGFIKCSLVVLESLYRLKWAVARGYFADKTYAIQPGRGKKAVGRIRVTEIRRERVQDISLADCLSEGVILISNEWGTPWYKSIGGEWKTAREAFAELWNSIHEKPGTRWADDPEVWALTFELEEMKA